MVDTVASWKIDDFDLIQLTVGDMNGIPRGKVIPRKIAPSVFRKGTEYPRTVCCVGVNAEFPMQVQEVMSSGFDNGVCIPIAETLVEVPWASTPGCRVGEVICHILKEDGLPEATVIRYQVEKLLSKLESLGLTLLSNNSIQFKAFKTGTSYTQVLGQAKGSALSPYGALGAENVMARLCQDLGRAGVEVKSWTHGDGAGSFELSLPTLEGLHAADVGLRLKHSVKGLMTHDGYDATFMTQPGVAGDATSSLWKFSFTVTTRDGQNAFLDLEQEDKLSNICRSFLAGLLRHGPAMTALCTPTVNCFRRRHQDPSGPTKADWDFNSSSAFISVMRTSDAVWLENRLPTSACNLYSVLVAVLASGIDGIEKGMLLPAKSDQDATPLPESLEEALEVLHNDELFTPSLSSVLAEAFYTIKKEHEVTKIKEMQEKEDTSDDDVKALERQLYFFNV